MKGVTHTYTIHHGAQVSAMQLRVHELELQSDMQLTNEERIQLTARCEVLEKLEKSARTDLKRAVAGESMWVCVVVLCLCVCVCDACVSFGMILMDTSPRIHACICTRSRVLSCKMHQIHVV